MLSKIQQVKSVLPAESQDPVVIKQTGETTALMYLSFNSAELTGSQITDYLTRVVQPRLQTINGVANAQILGGQTFAMRIWLNPDKMAALGVTPVDVRNALAATTSPRAAGQVKGDFMQTTINAQTSLDNPPAFGKLVVVTRGDALIRLDDIATIELGPESADSSSVFDGLKAVFIGVFATPTSNPLTVIGDVRKAFPDIQRQLPAGMEARHRLRRHQVHQRLDQRGAEDAAGGGPHRHRRDLPVPGQSALHADPDRHHSAVADRRDVRAAGARLLHQSADLLALVLAIGLVVDDAIVVVENIHRHIEEGMQPFEAALAGAREIAVPVISMTITLAAVYAPIGFVSGLTGALFREFAFTLAGAVVVSGVIALTLSPMMASKLLKHDQSSGRFVRFLDRTFDGLRRRYERRLHRTLNFRPVTLLILAGVIAATGIMYVTTQKELAPEEDQGILFNIVKAPQTANLDYLEQATGRAQQGVRDGAGEGARVHHQRHGRQRAPGHRRHPVQAVGGAQAHPEGDPAEPAAEGGGHRRRARRSRLRCRRCRAPTGGPPVQFVITTTADYPQLAQVLAEIQAEAQKSGLFIFTDTDLKFETPQIELKIDHDKANRLGVTMQDIGGSLATLLGGNYVNRFNLYGRSYQVIPQVPREYRLTADWLKRYQVRTSTGALVPLSSVATVAADRCSPTR